MTGDDGIDVYLGLDVGKGEHHATALTPVGAFDGLETVLEPVAVAVDRDDLAGAARRCWRFIRGRSAAEPGCGSRTASSWFAR
ncbi:hypothetical protein [Streptomyces osmaniensis]|uniref:Transposase n=1 Tax=Streptomyces osmaniensis TaxID=593134 RepID=A0ABP6Z2B3_9ACTN|nr:hypothetical protein KJK32_46500 [Streptomyces sp. JCM17656]